MVTCGRCSKPFKVGAPPTAAVARPAAITQQMVAPNLPPPPRPQAAPPGTYEPEGPSIKESLRGVFKSLMPFSKVDQGGPILIQPAGPRPPGPPRVEDDDVGFD